MKRGRINAVMGLKAGAEKKLQRRKINSEGKSKVRHPRAG